MQNYFSISLASPPREAGLLVGLVWSGLTGRPAHFHHILYDCALYYISSTSFRCINNSLHHMYFIINKHHAIRSNSNCDSHLMLSWTASCYTRAHNNGGSTIFIKLFSVWPPTINRPIPRLN